MNLESEFPSLSSLRSSKSSQSASQPPQQQSKPAPEPKTYTIDADLFKEISPESISQTDLTPQDFGFALTSSLNLIPDTPFEIEQTTDEKSETSQYPQYPMMKLLQPEFFSKYDLDTLFFIFFYLTGTSQQYFAGKELKKRGWVFHKQYQTWFRLVGAATETTDKYQLGKFEYFDHGSTENWMIRPRSGFKLEFDMIEKE